MESSDITAEIRMAVLGEWVPPQLADVLAPAARRRAGDHAPAGWTDPGRGAELPGDGFDFALSAAARQWPGWICEPLWHDTWRSPWPSAPTCWPTVKCRARKCSSSPDRSQSTADEPWRRRRAACSKTRCRSGANGTFDVAMTLVAAGYGIAIAPAARLASYHAEASPYGAAGRRTNDRDGLPAPPQRYLVGHPGKIRPTSALGVLTDALAFPLMRNGRNCTSSALRLCRHT